MAYEQTVVLLVADEDLTPAWCPSCAEWVLKINTPDGVIKTVVDAFQTTPETMVLRPHNCQGPKAILPFRGKEAARG